jgi:carbon starvation protein
MPIAVAMGVALRHGRIPIGLVTALGVGALLLSVFAGQFLKGSPLEPMLTLDGKSLAWGIMIYGVLASVLPVWLLLAPRDYLSTFMKLGTIGLAIVWAAAQMPALTKFMMEQAVRRTGLLLLH